jgi:RluA family pseudouridine synthase
MRAQPPLDPPQTACQMNTRSKAGPGADPGPDPLPMDAFASDAISKIFRFEFEGEPQPLKPYLLSRYQFGREAKWRDTFYPDRVRLNGQPVTDETWVASGDTVAYRHLRAEEPPPPTSLPILYEDDWLVAVHKPDSVPVSPSGLYYYSSLALLARELFNSPDLTPIHRLDLETSGVLLLARRKADISRFHDLFVGHRVTKRYLALVYGAFPTEVTGISGKMIPHPASAIHTKLWLDPHGISNTVTHIVRTARHEHCSELELEPVTGKTNQLRVHLAHAGHAIVGDKKYHPDESLFLDWLEHRNFETLRPKLWLSRQALQCQSLSFVHPFTGQPLTISALPGSWKMKVAEAVSAPKFG